MKKFIRKVVITSFPIVIILIGVNYFGDAAKLFDSEYEKMMAAIVLNGNYVTNITDYDERIFQKELINGMNNSPEVLVIGSSRTMLINSRFFLINYSSTIQ